MKGMLVFFGDKSVMTCVLRNLLKAKAFLLNKKVSCLYVCRTYLSQWTEMYTYDYRNLSAHVKKLFVKLIV